MSAQGKKGARAATMCACGQPVTDAYLCPSCARTLAPVLIQLADALVLLEDTYARRDVVADITGGGAVSFREPPLPFREPAARLRRQADDLLGSASAALWRTLGASGRLPRVSTAQARYMAHHARVIGVRCAEAATWLERARDLHQAVMQAVDAPPTPVYLGACEACSLAMYAVRGQDVHQCTTCGASYDVRARLAALLVRARIIRATPGVITAALTSLNYPVTEGQIRKWAQRGLLSPASSGPRPGGGRQTTYVLGDVIDLVTNQRARLARVATRREGAS